MKYRRFYSLIMLAIVTGVILSCSGSGTGNAPGARDPKQVNLGISGNAIQVTSGADNEDQPAIAFDRNNTRYLTVWADYRSGNADVYGKLCDAKTAGFGLNAPTPVCGAEFLIADGGGSGNQWQPKVAFDYNSNKYLVVYADTSATYSQIYGRFISAAGVPDILGSFRISQHLDVADPSQIEPDVIYNDFRNTFTVGWLGTSNYDTVDYPAASPVASSFTPTWKSGYTTTIVNANAIVSVTLPGGTPLTNYTVSPANPDATNSTSVLTINSSSNVIGTSGDLTVTYADSSKTNDGTTTALTGGPPTVFAANDSFSISPLAPQTDLALANI